MIAGARCAYWVPSRGKPGQRAHPGGEPCMLESKRVTMSSENSPQPPVSFPPITDATLISRSPTVLTAEVDGEILMMSIEHGCYFSVNDVGLDIWRRLDPPCSFADLIDELAADYDASRATIVEDVRALLSRMLAEDIVRLA
jgi:Coenzyme PQQ synthesis protein D (PqqD)